MKGTNIMMLRDIVEFESGTPQFRITEDALGTAPEYLFYAQNDLTEDLSQTYTQDSNRKRIRTFDEVTVAKVDDVLFSLISGSATIVGEEHDGYLITQNYVKIIPSKNVDPLYLVYLLNESQEIKRQFSAHLQGSMVLKYTLRMLNELTLPKLIPKERQTRIGMIYFAQKRLEALKHQVATMQTMVCLHHLEEVK